MSENTSPRSAHEKSIRRLRIIVTVLCVLMVVGLFHQFGWWGPIGTVIGGIAGFFYSIGGLYNDIGGWWGTVIGGLAVFFGGPPLFEWLGRKWRKWQKKPQEDEGDQQS